MTELCPELDKLRNKELSFGRIIYRNKELSFGCIIYQDYLQKYFTVTKVYDEDNIATVESDLHTQLNEVEVIGKPLTWGRIVKLRYDFNLEIMLATHPMDKQYSAIASILHDEGLMDKDELQRMQHQKRPELKESLIKFSDYI